MDLLTGALPDVWVVFPLARERQPFQRCLGTSAGEPLRRLGVTPLLLGMGQQAARRFGARLSILPAAVRPRLVVIAGVAGALDPSLGVGDIVVAAELRVESGGPLSPFSPSVGGECRTGTLLSLDRVLVTAAEKRAAADRHDALAVEMETAGVAAGADGAGIPWVAVRAISDRADESLPLDFNRLRTADGDLPVGRVARAALRHPASIPGLLRLGRNTDRAAASLAAFLCGWLPTAVAALPPGGRHGD
jgi:adenosylhomocysteine nucleosidase